MHIDQSMYVFNLAAYYPAINMVESSRFVFFIVLMQLISLISLRNRGLKLDLYI